MKSLVACVVLAGLPLVASADETVSGAQCGQLAERFGNAAREMSIGDLDQLKTCITIQREAMAGSLPQTRPQLAMTQKLPRPSLRDDL